MLNVVGGEVAGIFFLPGEMDTIHLCAGGTSQHDNTPLTSTQAASLMDFTVDIGGSADFPLIKAHGQCCGHFVRFPFP